MSFLIYIDLWDPGSTGSVKFHFFLDLYFSFRPNVGFTCRCDSDPEQSLLVTHCEKSCRLPTGLSPNQVRAGLGCSNCFMGYKSFYLAINIKHHFRCFKINFYKLIIPTHSWSLLVKAHRFYRSLPI